MSPIAGLATTRQPKPQVAGQLELPLTPVLPVGIRVVVNRWITRGWNDKAACAKTDNPAFYSDDEAIQTTAAREICGSCPVRRACLASALLHDEQGVWGATTEAERATITVKLAKLSPYWAGRTQACLPGACRTDWAPGDSTTALASTSAYRRRAA